MFRMLKLKPPHGWNAVAWELVIVTVGVLMALFLQQWTEDAASRTKTARARAAIRDEVREHYLNAVEWRTFSPCVSGQLERIEGRILDSASPLKPIEIHRIGTVRVAVMAPGRIYDASAWQGAISEGTAFQLTDAERRKLTNEHWMADKMDKMGDEWADADQDLLAATRPIQLDPGVKLALLNAIDRMQARNDRMSLRAAEIMFWAEKLGAAPSAHEVQDDLRQNSQEMYFFCKEQRLPTRDLKTALDPNS